MAKKKHEYVCKVVLVKVKGSNVVPSALYLHDYELKSSVLDVMEPGDEIIVTTMTYEEFLKALPDKDVRE